MTCRPKTETKETFGSFLQGCVDGTFTRPAVIVEDDPQAMKRAVERVFGPRKLKDALTKIERLEREVRIARGRMTRQRSSREAGLKEFIRAAKHKLPTASHLEIAKRVDSVLSRAIRKLAPLAPQQWRNYQLPTMLADVFNDSTVDPRLKNLVKSYISKA